MLVRRSRVRGWISPFFSHTIVFCRDGTIGEFEKTGEDRWLLLPSAVSSPRTSDGGGCPACGVTLHPALEVVIGS